VPEEIEALRSYLSRNAQYFFSTWQSSLSAFIESKSQNNITKESISEQNNNVVSTFISDLSLDNVSIAQVHYMLEHWAPTLNCLSTEEKLAVWESCGKPTVLKNFAEGICNMDTYISEWKLDLDENKQIIINLYHSIVKLHELDILKDEFYSPSYIVERLKEFMDDIPVQTSLRKENYEGSGDNLSDFKKAYSAPSVIFTTSYVGNIKKTEVKDNIERSLSQQNSKKGFNPFNIFNNSEKSGRSAFTIVKKEFEKMVIKEDPEQTTNTTEYDMKDVEETTTTTITPEDQSSPKKISIKNLLS